MKRTCYRCGRGADAGARCECGEPLWLETDAASFEWPDSPERGLWRYADLLPVRPPGGIASTAGGTPLLRTERLDRYAGCTLFVKDETANPTGSFKDRGSAVGVTRAVEAGDEWVGTVSHGNMAISTAAHAGGVGLNCLVLVPDDIPPERLDHVAEFDPELVRVAGEYGRLYENSLDLPGVRFVNSDTPYRVAGQKTTALEICEAFARTGESSDDRHARGSLRSPLARSEARGEGVAPDAIVLPVSSGGHASATWKAVRELREAGLLDEPPRLYFVQAAPCDPIARAYRSDADEVTAVEADETVAYSIANPAPPSGNRALSAARETGGAVVSVPDDAILDAKRRLSRRVGLSAEPASATALAGVRRLSDDDELSADDHVVAVATGTGFRERSSTAPAPRSVPLAELPERVRSLVSG